MSSCSDCEAVSTFCIDMASERTTSSSGFNSPFHNSTALHNNTTPSNRRPSFYSSNNRGGRSFGNEIGDLGEKLDIMTSQLSEQKQSLQCHHDELMGIIHSLGSEISALREDFNEVRSELSQLKAVTPGPMVKKKQLIVPRNVSVS